MRAIPKIQVRIDRGEDWAELCGDWQDTTPPLCGQGDLKEWLDVGALQEAWLILNKAVLE